MSKVAQVIQIFFINRNLLLNFIYAEKFDVSRVVMLTLYIVCLFFFEILLLGSKANKKILCILKLKLRLRFRLEIVI